jgi:hypothetical protein
VTGLDPVKTALHEAVPPFTGSGDWADVLHRAGRGRGRAAFGSHSPGIVALAALVGLIAILATPALGLGDRLRELIRPQPTGDVALFAARLTSDVGEGTGKFEATIRGIGFRRPGKRPLRLFKPPFRWKLTYQGLSSPVRSAHLHVGGRRHTLCAPCPTSPATGRLDRVGLRLLETAGHRAFVDIHTVEHPGGELRGRVTGRLRRAP